MKKSEKIGAAYRIIDIQKKELELIDKHIKKLEAEKWELIESISGIKAALRQLEEVSKRKAK